jgi:hypothetical protein
MTPYPHSQYARPTHAPPHTLAHRRTRQHHCRHPPHRRSGSAHLLQRALRGRHRHSRTRPASDGPPAAPTPKTTWQTTLSRPKSALRSAAPARACPLGLTGWICCSRSIVGPSSTVHSLKCAKISDSAKCQKIPPKGRKSGVKCTVFPPPTAPNHGAILLSYVCNA